MYPHWGPIAFSWQLGRWSGQTVSCCVFWRERFVLRWGQNYKHDDSLGPCPSIHLISTFFSATYDIRCLIGWKFRGFASKIGGFVSIAMFRGGRRQISRDVHSKYQYWYWMTMNHNHSMERASNDSPWYTWGNFMLMKGPLYRCGK